jgi:hypothetical protein
MRYKSDFNPECITFCQMNLIFNARDYYRRLTTWISAYVTSRYLNLGNVEEVFGRLYLESLDVGNMMRMVYNRDLSNQYGQMISQYAINLREILSAQINGDVDALNHYINVIYEENKKRAEFLASINPYWDQEEWISLIDDYLQHTIEETNSFAAGDFTKSMEHYDKLMELSNTMGDYFAQGLYNYITSGTEYGIIPPPQANTPCITYDQMNLIYNVREFWYELVTWVRNYMLSKYIGLGDINQVYERLRQVPVKYLSSMNQIFGDKITGGYVQLVDEYIDLIDAFTTAQLNGNTDQVDQLAKRLYQIVDKSAEFIASVNPLWNEDELKKLLNTNLRAIIDESGAIMTGDYARSIDIFSRLLDQADSIGNYLVQGLFNHMSQQGASENSGSQPENPDGQPQNPSGQKDGR